MQRRQTHFAAGVVLQQHGHHLVVALLQRDGQRRESILEKRNMEVETLFLRSQPIRKGLRSSGFSTRFRWFFFFYRVSRLRGRVVGLTSVARLWLAPLAKRKRTTPSWFSCAAMYSGVKPFCD